jgi:hypothetical protein
MSARSLDHDETKPKNAGLEAAATKANSALAIFASIIAYYYMVSKLSSLITLWYSDTILG